ncbi:hypothetical protein EV702DRAFT_928628, partial [Suillus placidus]
WSKPGHQEATIKFFKLCQVYEEITRLNVEVHCLRTAIHDEDHHMLTIIQKLQVSDPHLGCELQHQHHSCAAINAMHCYHLDRIESLTGFSG